MNASATPLTCQRERFTMPASVCYLNSAYMGPLSAAVQAAAGAAIARRGQPWRIGAEDFFAPAELARARCAQLINAGAESIALVPTSSHGIASVARNLARRLGPSANIVVLGEQFPSNIYAWRSLVKLGARIRSIDAPQSSSLAERAAHWNQRVLEAIDADTALVAIESCHWTDGTRFDLAAIGARCREVDAWYLIDGTQTVGAQPFDVTVVKPDALIVHAYKSMLSEYGLGFAYFSDRLSDGEPIEHSWLMRAGAEDFSRLVDYQDDFAPGMRRYDSSVRATGVLIHALNAACEQLLQWQPSRIEQYCYHISRPFEAQADALGIDIAPESARAANIFGLRFRRAADLQQLRAKLADLQIYLSVRGSSIRVSPHVYNDESDFARLAEALID